jgi:ketosteroid isomerase-like protein
MTDTLANVARELDAMNRAYEAAFAESDLERMVDDYYAPDFRMVVPDRAAIRSRSELIDLLKAFRSTFATMRLEPLETAGDPDGVVYQIANSTLYPAGSGEPVAGRYVTIFSRHAGRWRCNVDFFAYGYLT